MAELNAGIFQIGPDISGGEAQRRFLARLKQVAVETGRPVMFGTLSSRQGDRPNPWTYQLEYLDECAAAGARMWGQTTTRSINAIFSLKSYLPFDVLPAWRRLRALAARRAEATPRRSRDAPATDRGRSGDEAARQRVPGRRRRDHRSAQAGLRQPLRHEGRRLGRSDRRRSSPRERGAAPGRGDDRPGRWRTTIRCSCSRWSTRSRTTCSAC